MSADTRALENGLLRANTRTDEVVAALRRSLRVDLAGLPLGASALVLANAARTLGAPFLVVTSTVDEARRVASDLAFFTGASDDERGEILVHPASDTSPFLEVAPDRKAAMDRLSVLFHLAEGMPFQFLVAPVAGLLRRVPPRDAIAARSCRVVVETEVDRDALLKLLTEGGYLRVPVVEDPGTFSVRGGMIDVYPPHARYPARIELDDWLVLSIKLFDPDDQRTVGDATEIAIHPVREALLGDAEIALAKERVRALCDEVNLPSSKTRQVVAEVESGRAFFGLEGLLPAFYDRLDTLFDYLPPETRVALLDPTDIARAAEDELGRAARDRAAKVEDGAPAFPLDALYTSAEQLVRTLDTRPLAVIHRVAVTGRSDENESVLARYETVAEDALLHLGGEDHRALASDLAARRGGDDRERALAPLAARAATWLEGSLRVFFTARTQTQADRLASLLRGYGTAVAPKPAAFSLGSLEKRPPGRVEVVVGSLAHGFVLPTAAVAFVTEEEIFGTRSQRRTRAAKGRDKAFPFSLDLGTLTVGDFVVHTDHGVGRYVGLERKALGQTQLEKMQGREPSTLEVVVIEYGGGDRLFLPVSRLDRIQKFQGQEGQKAPKLDKLGGQSFAKTKSRVAKEVRQLADELLRLYAQRSAARRDPLGAADRLYAEFEATFPFEETTDQARAIDEVLSDLEAPTPMDRVVCGDVGFGKTEVAIRAAFRVAMSGRQVAVLCPTTVLAQQHFMTFRERMKTYPVRVEVLSRFVDAKRQTEIVAAAKEGKVDILIGTHRLLSKDIHFKTLGLLVVDEEQRFGVAHKERIKKLRTSVDVLTLSATPIPRTLQLAVGGLRDLSLITTAPVDRRAVRTIVTRWDDHVLREAIQRELGRGGQAFFVYNRIEGLYERAQRLQELIPNAKLAVGHGQMSEGQLEQVMTDFVEGRYDILCSTAIIETGLDIPRANTIIVDRADTFGLSQLYQIRGRVGRSRERAYCYLVTPPPSQMTDEARYRIEALERFTQLGSGFQVATLDMELRGAGDLLGGEQSGNVSSVGFDLFVHMLEDAVRELRGETVVSDVDPELTLDVEHFLPEDYVEDVGVRLSLYKRFASAPSDEAVAELAAEMEDRFGKAPPPARAFARAMRLKPALRALKVLGCEATTDRVVLHLREDTPLDPAEIMKLVAQPRSPWKLTPEMKLIRRFPEPGDVDAIERAEELLSSLAPLVRAPAASSGSKAHVSPEPRPR